MRTTSIFIIIILFLVSCYKTKEEKNYFIQGRLLLTDSLLLQHSQLPLAGKRVFLAEDNGDTLNFLYTDTTDSEGYFVFRLLEADAGKAFLVRFSDSIQGYHFTGKENVKSGMDNVVLNARLNMAKENALFLYAKDEQGEALPGTNIRLYTSQALALQNAESGVAYSFNANETGRAFKTRIPKGKYYINASKVSDTLVYERIAKPVDIAASGIMSDTVVLRRKNPVILNRFTVHLKDSLNGAIPGATVFIFTSQVLASTNDSAGAIKVLSSDATGKISQTNLPAGQYFLNAHKQVDTIVYHRVLKSIVMSADGALTDTMVLRRKVQ